MPTGNAPTTMPDAPPTAPAPINPNNLREKILTAIDVEWEPLHIAQWDVTVIVRSGSGEQRADLLDAAVKYDEATDKTTVDLKKIYPDLVIHSVIDPTAVHNTDAQTLLDCKPEDRKRYAEVVGAAENLFTVLDREGLLAKNGAALEAVGKVAGRLWGLDKEAEKAAVKNSKGTPNADSTSGS